METSPTIGEITKALSLAQGEIKGALKDSDNPFFKSRYADLASVWEACRGPLGKHQLAVFQSINGDPTGVIVTTMLAHSSGEWVRDQSYACPKDMTPQSVGSATTYLRRYGLAAIVGIVQVDDDAESAQPRGEKLGPRGDDVKAVPVDRARELATRMRGVLESDLEDTAMALRVMDLHDELNKHQDEYIASADQLSAKERKAWKELLRIGKTAQSAPLSNGRG